MTDFRGWQFDPKDELSKSVRDALQNYIDHNGLPEQILLETGLEEVPLPESMNIVMRSVRIPKNVLLVGEME